jgi:hypothetical protein
MENRLNAIPMAATRDDQRLFFVPEVWPRPTG